MTFCFFSLFSPQCEEWRPAVGFGGNRAFFFITVLLIIIYYIHL